MSSPTEPGVEVNALLEALRSKAHATAELDEPDEWDTWAALFTSLDSQCRSGTLPDQWRTPAPTNGTEEIH